MSKRSIIQQLFSYNWSHFISELTGSFKTITLSTVIRYSLPLSKTEYRTPTTNNYTDQ